MTTIYIYLVNQSTSKKTVYGFMGTEQPSVTASIFWRSTMLATLPPPPSTQTNVWTIPLDYHLIATAGVEPVGSTYVPQSSVAQVVQLGEHWKVNYYQAIGQHLGPDIQLFKTLLAGDTFDVTTNSYDKALEPITQWYGGLGLGLPTPVGDLQQLWSPSPASNSALSVLPIFYVYKGDYTQGTYLLHTKVPAQAQRVTLSDVDAKGCCTVTLKSDGSWDIQAGTPS